MGENLPGEQLPRIPTTVNGIQVNFCKNPNCLNFGRPASEEVQPRGRMPLCFASVGNGLSGRLS